MDVAARRAAQQLGRRGIELVDDFDHQRRATWNAGRDAGREPEVVVVGGKHHRPSIGVGNLDIEIGQRGADRIDVEKIGGCQQAITAAADTLQRQPGGFRLLQKLRHAGARQPHRRGEVFARVECAVGKLAQKRESKRSKHKLTSCSTNVES